MLTTDEVDGVVDAFVMSARHSVEAGFEMIELHGAHGYLIAQFLNARVNTRQDRYGGSVVGRATFVIEILGGIRAALPGVPVGLRVSVENETGGLSLGDFHELLPAIQERAPFDYLNLTYGSRGYYVRDMATTTPPLLGQTSELRRSVGVPLILCSAFRRSEQMVEALATGAADMVGMARAHIADPEISRKLLDGREDEVRPCVACLQDCRSFDPTALCTVNPELAPRGQELRLAEPYVIAGPGRGGRTLAVVGAGPAGLECALTAARDGACQVTVFDAKLEVGGAIAVAGAAAHRSEWRALLDFYARNLARLGVTVRLGGAVSGPDRARRVRPRRLGDRCGGGAGAGAWPLRVLRSTDYLVDPPGGPGTVVVADDGFGWWPTVSAVETALDRGAARVVVITPAAGFAAAIPAESRMQLIERLRGVQLDIVPLTRVSRTVASGVVTEHLLSGATTTVPADLLVTVGARRQRQLPTARHPSLQAIGDCVSPRKVSEAIAEGRRAGLAVVNAR